MTVLPELLQLSLEGVTAADYEAIPEDVCRRVEIASTVPWSCFPGPAIASAAGPASH